MTLKLEDRNGWTTTLENTDLDEHRLSQLTGRWVPAAEMFCRIGCPNPFGFGRGAELHEVRIVSSRDELLDAMTADLANARDM